MSFGLVDSKTITTKTALKAAVNSGAMVLVFDTSVASRRRSPIPIYDLQPHDVIVGPNVYDNRKWYANYKNGKIV